MIAVSNDFKRAMTRPVKELDAYINADTYQIKSADDLISFKISCDTGMCKTAMRKLEAKYVGEHNLLGQWVNVGFGVRLENQTFEYLDYGSFLITEITTSKDTGVTQIVGYDKMINTMTEYTKLDVTYPISLYEYTKLLCRVCGLDLGNETLINGSWTIDKELWENIDGITYRDIFVQIAQATGSTCIIGSDNKVYFKYLFNTGEQLTYDNMFKLKLEPMYGEINSVVLSRTPAEDNIYKRDEASIEANGLTEFKIENNEIIDKNRDLAMIPIYNTLHGISYYPFETTTEGLGWYEIADTFNIINDTGDIFKVSLFNFSISIDGSIKEILKTVADTKTQTQYQYATPIGKRVKNTEIIVNKQEQYIEELVTDVYDEDGIIHKNFTKVYQDIDNIINSVQNSGGNNLIKNSVMFAYDDNGIPSEWDVSECGINICNSSLFENNKYQNYGADNKKIENNTYWFISGFQQIEANTQYIGNLQLTWSGMFYDENKQPIEKINANNNGYGFLTPNNAKYVVINFPTSLFNIDTIQYQIKKGSIQSPYIPYHTDGLIIDSNTESLTAGAISGHSFTLLDKFVYQTVRVKKDEASILEENKTYYTFSTRIKKATTGNCYIKIYNSVEEYIIEVPVGTSSYYKEFEITLLPKDTYYTFEFYGSSDSEATFTDNMLALGNYKSQWTQASGEIMNTQVNINLDGVLVKSSVYLGDYTVMSPLEFAGYSKINGVITKVFSLNKDTTLVKKLEAEDEVKMVPIKIVPITAGDMQGWAFVPST